ncbi:MAG: isoprenylcysteine carboxylmethyltransferase family protein [Rhodanobacter sp.]
MSILELRIPPPVVLLIVAIAMWLTAYEMPPTSRPELRIAAAALLALSGVAIAVAGALALRRAKTTTNPLQPQTASVLVVTGVYKHTRNPMYVGLCLLLVAWAVCLWSAWALFGPVVFIFYISRFQIRPEERALTALFDSEYPAYKARVRPWLLKPDRRPTFAQRFSTPEANPEKCTLRWLLLSDSRENHPTHWENEPKRLFLQ